MIPLRCDLKIDPTQAVSWKKLLALFFLGLLCVSACGKNRALERIEESGTITVITNNNAHSYYTYRDQDMGFEYDVAKAFAEH